MNQPFEIFCCAAEADKLSLEKLKTQLTLQEQQGVIKLWDKSQIPVGANADLEISRHLTRAGMFLLLIGPEFLRDDYCYKKVMRAALKRHTDGDAKTIPVIVRPADWKNVPVLKDIQPLPRNGEPISSLPDENHAIWGVAKEIISVIEELTEDRPYGGIYAPPIEVADPPIRTHTPKDPPPKSPFEGGGNILDDPITNERSRQNGHSPGKHKPILKQRWAWTLVGLLILLSGVLWGVSSPTHKYIGPPKGEVLIKTTDSSDTYFCFRTVPECFIARYNDFPQPFDPKKIHPNAWRNFDARPDTISVNETIWDRSVTQAHVIEKLESQDQGSTQPITYKTRNYNDEGYYESRWWPIAAALIASGLLIAYVALFLGRKRRNNG